MRKLKLDVEALEVTSFEVSGRRGERGTVAGHLNQEAAANTEAWMDTCENTCASCYGACGPTNNGGVCGSNSACAICLID